jgi:hypothetical protein
MAHTRLAIALALFGMACGGTDKGTDSSCIEGAAEPSVQLVVTDATGGALGNATVTWSNGGAEEPCDQVSNQFLCGMDETGEITVTGSADGYVTQSKTVTVESDGCHAITAQEVLRLEEA